MRLQLDGEVTVSLVGVVLKMVLSRCPGHLGNILRMLPACARRQFRQTPIELLPMSVPEETQAELRLHRLLLDNEQPRALTDSERARQGMWQGGMAGLGPGCPQRHVLWWLKALGQSDAASLEPHCRAASSDG